MNHSSRRLTSIDPEVYSYYQRNWDRIVHCYDLDSSGHPVDPAWYRRRLYNDFLVRENPRAVLDVGCGAGHTVLDALEDNRDCHGIEPVMELVDASRKLLKDHDYDPLRISQGDLSSLSTIDTQYDCVSLLSVLPAISIDEWAEAHKNIAATIKTGGSFYAAYRNQLFDLYTFNSFTIELYESLLWNFGHTSRYNHDTLAALKNLIVHSDLPGPYHTNSPDRAFGRLQRPKTNPLTIAAYLAEFGLKLENIRFYHYHAVPPLISDSLPNLKEVNHSMELELSDDWRGNFMAAMFVVEARKF